MEEYKSVQKYLQKQSSNKKNISFSILNRIFISVILLLVVLCITKVNTNFKDWIYKNVYQTNFYFAKLNSTYEKYFGNIFPLSKVNNTTPVFNEQLTYSKEEAYKDGVKLTVTNNYLVPVQYSGIVIFVGEKENYGNTIIIDSDDKTIWYSNINSNIKLYDEVIKGEYLGETASDKLYLVFQKDGKIVDYKEYI